MISICTRWRRPEPLVIDLQRLITGHIVATATAALTGRPGGESLVQALPAAGETAEVTKAATSRRKSRKAITAQFETLDASQAPTVYAPQGAQALAPTVASALYPQEGGNLAVSPGSPPPVASATPYPGSQAASSSPPAGAPYGLPLARRKSRRGLWIALAVLAVVLVAGSGVAYYVVNLFSPAHFAQAGCDDVKNGNWSDFYNNSTADLQSQFGPEDQWIAAQQQYGSQHGGVVSCTITTLTQNGSTATGTAVVTYGDGSQVTVDFAEVLENGGWKLSKDVPRGS